ncbi:MAG: hypothetical protein AAF568_03880 [Pseudomonadota bacterium]
MNDTIEFSDQGEGGTEAPAIRIPITIKHNIAPPPEEEIGDLTTSEDGGDDEPEDILVYELPGADAPVSDPDPDGFELLALDLPGDGAAAGPVVRIPITVKHNITPPPEEEVDDLTTPPDAGDADLLVA